MMFRDVAHTIRKLTVAMIHLHIYMSSKLQNYKCDKSGCVLMLHVVCYSDVTLIVKFYDQSYQKLLRDQYKY